MIRKPRTKAGARAIQKKEPVVEEGAKTCIFLKGTSTSQLVTDVAKQLLLLKKPNSVNFAKRNDIRPFEDVKPLEFFGLKNNASLFCLSSHSKKRPHNMVFVRLYEYHLLDMFELGILNFKNDFDATKPELGNRPLIVFNGQDWTMTEETKTIKSIFLDMFTGDKSAEKLDLRGLSHTMVFTLVGEVGKPFVIQLRVYQIVLKKSGTDIPRVELVEMGPSVDFVQRRCIVAQPQVWKEATKMPKVEKPKQKNVETNEIGETMGRVWVEPQDLSTLQTRKMKGLKRKADEEVDEDDDDDE